MSGLRSFFGENGANAAPQPGERELVAIALELHRATHAGTSRVTLNELAAATGIPIVDVMSIIALLERRRLVRIRPRVAEPLAPVDWLKATREEQLRLMGMNAVEMTPFLPSLLEGKLDYSPSSDEREAARVVDQIEPPDFPPPEEIIARINLPRQRAREALARYTRGPLDVGMRLRITFDVTFPEMTHDNAIDLERALESVIASNRAVRCEDVRLRESTSISLSE